MADQTKKGRENLRPSDMQEYLDSCKETKSKGGRPRIVDDPDLLWDLGCKYFDWADSKGWPYTVPDLALFLGFCGRRQLFDYRQRLEFKPTLDTLIARIEAQRARQLVSEGNSQGKIFDLKNNFGWKDSQQMEIGNADGLPFKTRGEVVDSILDEIEGKTRMSDRMKKALEDGQDKIEDHGSRDDDQGGKE